MTTTPSNPIPPPDETTPFADPQRQPDLDPASPLIDPQPSSDPPTTPDAEPDKPLPPDPELD
ncbi:hypothetical protein [Kribbella sp. VKM Ac-2571]|uniref:hypothetical protein n=1 Tax=Kribbella sp. VKM Ac-2571 TaxID=2512222 RepID=UPI00105D6985|nr:hypothetical protein [Kribbella sp. VKM Ac-2571]